jgi:hypothetical protein
MGERFNNQEQSQIVFFIFKATGNIEHNAFFDSFCDVK